MEMNGLLRRKMVVWNYSRLHTPEVGATTESNGSVATLSLSIEWRSHASSGRAHGTYEIEKYEWVSMERK